MAIQVELGNMERVLDRLVDTGRFNSRSEALEEGVRLLDRRERFLAEMEEGLQEGLADARAGRVYKLEDVRAELLKEFSTDD